ncbi:MAG: glycosyltransferase family 39 protein, partial [Chloroflexi bacterium]|nr:glycosyltransferase family 39 protein [Chloroflexota bacterium]
MRWTALAVCLLGFVLRVYALDQQSLWYDEAFSLLVSLRAPEEVIAATARDNNPPLYYLLLWAWSQAGGGEFWWRFLSALAGALVPPVTFALGRRTVGTGAALTGALLTAVAPFLVFYSQEMRMYALLCLCAVVAAYAWLRWAERGSLRWGFVCWAALTAGLYTHTFGVLTLLALGAAWAPWTPAGLRTLLSRKGLPVWRQATPLFGAALAFLPWLGVVAQ